MKKSIFILIFLFQTLGRAGINRVGNGGDVFVCRSKSHMVKGKAAAKNSQKTLPEIQTVELLDYMESEVPLVDYSGDHKAILKQVLEKLHAVAPQLADQYEKRLSKIEDEIHFQEFSLKDVQDSYEIIERKDCQLMQAAVRKNEIAFGEKRFTIQKLLWEKMDNHNKAGLLMHEIIYEHFFKLGEVTSVKARKVNALLFSKTLAKMTSQEFYSNLQKMDLPIYQR